MMMTMLLYIFTTVPPNFLAMAILAAAPHLCFFGEGLKYDDISSSSFLVHDMLCPLKRSFVNDAILKRGLLITLTLMTTLYACEKLVHGGGDRRAIAKPVCKMFCLYAEWFLVTAVFQLVEERTKTDCSGHCFILSLLALYILEECSYIVAFWRGLKLEAEEERQLRAGEVDAVTALSGLDEPTFAFITRLLNLFSPAVTMLMLSLAALLMLFLWNLVITLICFHTPMEKAIGTICGIASWAVMFKVMVPIMSEILPDHILFHLE